ncbi:hypothetical protein Ahy_B04g071910 isoform A [Arachis hypogaea]|uniref:Aminotransferase-like plant mobile domain-containing protein n=1 Tax=Arachis hypogaea TaxID=3818 RepID=A0A444ZLZ3_ARAHY|nr:hypothetical protein Ahy_B04g071910 isoform A [Arachis hypogaea]
MIFGLPTDGLPVSGFTDSSSSSLENEFMIQFATVPTATDHKRSGVKLAWLRTLKRRMQLDTALGRQMYVKIHILLLFGTNLFCDKSGMTIHWKFLPLLRNFAEIRDFSWGSACLAHLYRTLCRASRYNCKDVDGPLSLLCVWAWERLPFLAPVRSQPNFPLACSWIAWSSQFHGYKKWTISHIRQLIDDIPADGFVWNPYSHEGMGNIVVPNEILQHRLMWSATVPLISFECIEWHASDRVKRQFGLQQEVPSQPMMLAEAHNMVLTGPKNKDWRDEHNAYIMMWTNRLTSVLVGDPVVHYETSEAYMQWYNDEYGAHLRLTGYVPQPQPHPQPQPQPHPQPQPQPQPQPMMHPYQYPYTQPYTEPGVSFFSQLFDDSHSLQMPPYQRDTAEQSLNRQLYRWAPETDTSQWVNELLDPQLQVQQFQLQPPEINEQAPQCSRQSPQIVSGRSSVDSQVRRRSPSPRSGARRSIDSIQSDSIQSVARGIGFSNAVDFPQVQAPMAEDDNVGEDDSDSDSDGDDDAGNRVVTIRDKPNTISSHHMCA